MLGEVTYYNSHMRQCMLGFGSTTSTNLPLITGHLCSCSETS